VLINGTLGDILRSTSVIPEDIGCQALKILEEVLTPRSVESTAVITVDDAEKNNTQDATQVREANRAVVHNSNRSMGGDGGQVREDKGKQKVADGDEGRTNQAREDSQHFDFDFDFDLADMDVMMGTELDASVSAYKESKSQEDTRMQEKQRALEQARQEEERNAQQLESERFRYPRAYRN